MRAHRTSSPRRPRRLLAAWWSLSLLISACEPAAPDEELEVTQQPALGPTLPGGWSLAPIGAGVIGNAQYDPDTATFAVEGNGTQVAGSADNVYFVYRTFSGDGEIVGRVALADAPNSSSQAGVMVRASLSAGAAQVFLYQQPNGFMGYTRRAGTGTGSFLIPSARPAVRFNWMKIVRRGSTFTTYLSEDGLAWTAVQQSMHSGFATTAYYGMAVVSQDANATASAFFDALRLAKLPSDYSSQDVGSTGKTGSTAFDYDAGAFTVRGGGAQIGGTSDAFQFAYRKLAGDGELTARIASVGGPGNSPKGGIMLRQDLGKGSPHIFVYGKPTGSIAATWRTTGGGSSSSASSSISGPSRWVKLVRIGTSVTAYASGDGQGWTRLRAIALPSLSETVYVGLADSSGTSGTLATTTIDNVTFKPSTAQRANLVPFADGFFISREDVSPEIHDAWADHLEGCVSEGPNRRLLRFAFASQNWGRQAAVAGTVEDRPDLFVFSGAHGHFHFVDYNKYSLHTPAGGVLTARKQSFCLEDDGVSLGVPWASPVMNFGGCEVQGIDAGYADTYGAMLGCQYIELPQDAPDGDYVLDVSTNFIKYIVEDDYGDNATSYRLHIQGDSVTVLP
jgi:hypothetical protein